MKEQKEIVSLTGLFLQNTIKSMRKGLQEIVNDHEDYVTDEIDKLFEKIQDLLKQKATSESNNSGRFAKKWCKFTEGTWAYECLCLLREVADYLESVSEGKISRSYIETVEKYISEKWPSKHQTLEYKFSVPTLKKMKRVDKYTTLSSKKIEMLIDAVIVPCFEENIPFCKNYIEWMQDIDNFFVDKEREFSYTADEYKTIKECVESYSDLNNIIEFNRENLYTFLKELVCKLEAISESKNTKRANGDTLLTISYVDEGLDIVRKDIEKYYERLFCFPEGTIGLVKNEIDNMLWTAATSSFENYIFAKAKKSMTWKECKQHNGFMALMKYQIYRHLARRRDNEFIINIVKGMIQESKEELGVYISEEAEIENRVWIGENCYIGNCSIEKEVIISSGVILNAESIYIGKKSVLEDDVVIKGAVQVIINNGKINK